ncbi:DNA repair protein RecO [Stieleria varia]|uniref:DNA repair protein RecO n=1 Tax=Stieleria varia TaxID=2528005 RepID=A0A5C6B438_9BACT|nr:DNA repair protein RecO [Stieleria varia]TWU06046.1 DNA repair protein RecO [Stieleria varia]
MVSNPSYNESKAVAAEQTTAIVLRTIEFSETSLIVTLLTRDFGRVSAIAKGARRPKSTFEGSLDLLAVCRVVLIRKSTDALDLLTEAKLHRRFRAAERSLDRVYAGYYIAEMLRLLTDDHDPHPDLYDLAINALAQIDGDGNVALAMLGFDIQALRLLGHSPELRRCTDCGDVVARESRMVFALLGGGVVCHRCRAKQNQTVSMRLESIDHLERLQSANVSLPIEVKPQVYGELRAVISRYIQTIVGTMPRMQRFLPTRLTTGD